MIAALTPRFRISGVRPLASLVRQIGRVVRVRREHAAGGAHDRPGEGQAEDTEGNEEKRGQTPPLGAAAHGAARHHQVTAPARESRMHRAEGTSLERLGRIGSVSARR